MSGVAKDREQLEAAVWTAVTYHGDEGTSGYVLSPQQVAAILEAADAYAGRTTLTIPEIRDRIAVVNTMSPLQMRLFIAHLAGYAPGLFDEVTGWLYGDKQS